MPKLHERSPRHVVFPLLKEHRFKLYWLLFLILLAWIGVDLAGGELLWDMAHLLAFGLLGAAYLLGLRLWDTALVVLVLLLPQIWHYSIWLPSAENRLRDGIFHPHGTYLRVEGVIRERTLLKPPVPPLDTASPYPPTTIAPSTPFPKATSLKSSSQGTLNKGSDAARETQVRLLLGEARLWLGGEPLPLAELEVELPARSIWMFQNRRIIRAGGLPLAAERVENRLRIRLSGTEFHFRAPPVLVTNGESWSLRLRDRAAYYLSKSALAIYLPVVLGLRESQDPESREVAGIFRRVGISHLFAISGLHVGLIYGLLLLALRVPEWLFSPAQGWVHGPSTRRILTAGLVWVYIALIGFPLPAVRAALMGSILVWSGLWGTRTSGFLVLSLAALLMLADRPTLFYDISFQLSFISFVFLSVALRNRPDKWLGLMWRVPQSRGRRMGVGLLRAVLLNLWVTFVISLGLTPIISATFGQVSLLVFFGNLLMVPLMGLLILPVGLLMLLANLLALNSPPGGWMERGIFALADPLFTTWVHLADILDRLGSSLVHEVRIHWTPTQFFFYYAFLGGAFLLLRKKLLPHNPVAPSPA